MATRSNFCLVRDVASNPLSELELVELFGFGRPIDLHWNDGHMKFVQNDSTYFPIDGTHSYFPAKIQAKPYTLKELYGLLPGVQKVTIEFQDIPPHFEMYKNSYTDYSKTITDLEEHGLVQTFPSTNILRTDDRCFQIPNSKEFNAVYEVDILGMAHSQDLTQRVVDMWHSL
jgi:hypothetical protein